MSSSLTPEMLTAYFLKGSKPRSDHQIGVEWEKIGVYRDSAKAITYTGKNGVKAIFQGLIEKYGWKPVPGKMSPIALKKGHGSITLEPGGQIELSGQKAKHLDQNASELYTHLEEIKNISVPLGIAWLGIGAQPVSVAEEIEWTPKERYRIMQKSLKKKGALTFSMMKETASVQVSLDYSDEEDAITKLRLAMGLSPFLTAMFANSPLKKGKTSGYLSRRAFIWENTAPERSGILWDALDPKKGFQGYINYALKVPMLFLLRKEKWMAVRGINFKEFMEKGYQGQQATLADWELHLSGIFTEARLKQYVEIRSIDCQKTAMGLSAAALIKGIFYHEASLKKAYQLLVGFTEKQLKDLRAKAAVHGLKAALPNGEKIQKICLELLELADKGLEKEKKYLFPLRIHLERGITPAEIVLECFDARQPLLSCAAIEGWW